MIISVHTPKSAGTSLLHCLKKHFNVYVDYEHAVPLKNFYTRYPNNLGVAHKKWMKISPVKSILQTHNLVKKTKEYNCVHGHFSVMKYRFYPNAKFITFVRNPLERMISHYYFWKKVYEKYGNPEKDLYLDYIFKNNTSLDDFLFDNNLKNYQYNYLKGINLNKFDFIGIADEQYFLEDTKYLFNKILKCPIENSDIERLNKTDYNRCIADIDINAFKRFHKKDYEIYEYALKQRNLKRQSIKSSCL